MGAVRRHGKKWRIDYRDARGNRVREVAGDTRADAEAVLREREREVWIVKHGMPAATSNAADVAGIVEGFLLHKAASRSWETVRCYRTALGATVGEFKTPDGGTWPPQAPVPADRLDDLRQQKRTFYPGPLDVATVGEITPARMEQFIDANLARFAVRTLNLRIAVLKEMLTWARKSGRIGTNPIADVSRVGPPAKRRRYLSEAEVAAVLDASPEPWRTIWMAFLHTGMRKGELIGLRWSSVCFAPLDGAPHGSIRVEAETSKSHRWRDLPMTPALRRRLLALRRAAADPGGGHVFVTSTGRPMVSNLPRAFKRYVHKALVGHVERDDDGTWQMVYRDEVGETVREPLPGVRGWGNAKAELLRRRGHLAEGVSLHTLRHTFATQAIMNGANIKVVSDMLGHASIKTTLDIYAHALPKSKTAALAALPYVDGMGGDSEARVPTRSQESAASSHLVA